jgi:hypothetical protein
MLALAEAGEWEKLAELEQSRQPLFNQVFSQVVPDNAALAREVLSIDEKIMERAKKGLPDLLQQLSKLRNSGIAQNAYHTVQGFASGDD